jgi:serine/threonine protein kinase
MDRYEKLDVLGEGQFGTVVKARVKKVPPACRPGSLVVALNSAHTQSAAHADRKASGHQESSRD